VVKGFETVRAAAGSSVPALGVPAVVKGFKTVRAAPGSSVPALGVPAVVKGFKTVRATAGSSVPALGVPAVVKGFKTVRVAAGSSVPALGVPAVVNGFNTVSAAVGNKAPWSVANRSKTCVPFIVLRMNRMAELTAVPARFVTLMRPEVALLGTPAANPARIEVDESTVKSAGNPSKVTSVTPVKLAPVIVTQPEPVLKLHTVPTFRLEGVNDVITGPIGNMNATVLSVEVEAVLGLPAGSAATPAATEAITVPACVMPLTATV
jgi:hypothetical protein